MRNAMKKTERFAQGHFAVTVRPTIKTRLNALNAAAESHGKIKIGRSFIVDYALEELFKRPEAREAVIERKIDKLRAKILA